MKSSLPVILPVVSLLLVGQATAQNQYRLVAIGGARTSTVSETRHQDDGPKLRVASHSTADEPAAETIGEGYAAGSYAPAEAAGTACGCAYGQGGYGGGGNYGGNGWYGYNPDFGSLSGGMSVWPGVPACCDPWFGYCGEPRCNACSCHKGRYMYFHCRKDSCQPELLIWSKGDWKRGCKNKCGTNCGGDCGGTCGSAGCGTCGGNCYGPAAAGCGPVAMGCKAKTCATGPLRGAYYPASCRGASCVTGKTASNSCVAGSEVPALEPTNGPAIKAAPQKQTAPPRNELPTSARRTVSQPTL